MVKQRENVSRFYRLSTSRFSRTGAQMRSNKSAWAGGCKPGCHRLMASGSLPGREEPSGLLASGISCVCEDVRRDGFSRPQPMVAIGGRTPLWAEAIQCGSGRNGSHTQPIWREEPPAANKFPPRSCGKENKHPARRKKWELCFLVEGTRCRYAETILIQRKWV